jgi:lysophospholipase L1-like esterase
MPAVQGKTILIVGDSLSSQSSNGTHTYSPDPNVNRYGSPGDFFGAALARAGASVVINAKVGRSAHSFFTHEGGSQILTSLAQYDPDVVFVMLGTNDLGLDLGVDATQMARIRDAFPKADVWGIGPPTLAQATEAAAVAQMMQGVFGNFVDLRSYTRDMAPGSAYRTPDGVHFTATGARLVGDRLAQVLVTKNHVGLKIGAAALAFTALGLGLSFIIARRNELHERQ